MNQPTTDLWISWDEYHRAIETLALQIHESGWQFDQILCLARGGLRIGDVFSRLFQVPLSILSISSYRAENGTVQDALNIGAHVAQLTEGLSGNVLIVDDLVDSGVTFMEVEKWLREKFPAISTTKTAVIWYKNASLVQPDFFVEYVEGNPWIHQPFESYDGLGFVDLQKRLSKST